MYGIVGMESVISFLLVVEMGRLFFEQALDCFVGQRVGQACGEVHVEQRVGMPQVLAFGVVDGLVVEAGSDPQIAEQVISHTGRDEVAFTVLLAGTVVVELQDVERSVVRVDPGRSGHVLSHEVFIGDLSVEGCSFEGVVALSIESERIAVVRFVVVFEVSVAFVEERFDLRCRGDGQPAKPRSVVARQPGIDLLDEVEVV